MPHLEVRGAIDLSAVHRRFRIHSYREDSLVLKAQGCYLSQDSRTLLFDCLVAEQFLRQGFFVLCAAKDDAIMVRLLPRTSPEKTDGVKRSVAWIAAWLQTFDPSAKIGTSNLESRVAGPFPADAFPGTDGTARG